MTTTTYTLTGTDSSVPPQTVQATVVVTTTPAPLTLTATATPQSAPPNTPRTITGVAAGGTPPITYSLSPGGQPNNTTGVFTVTPP